MPMRLKTMIGDTWWPAGYYDSLFMADEIPANSYIFLYFSVIRACPDASTRTVYQFFSSSILT
jgi:hypothetical protein